MRDQFDMISGVFETTEFEIAQVACNTIVNNFSSVSGECHHFCALTSTAGRLPTVGF